MRSSTWGSGADLLASAALLVLGCLLLYCVGRPLFTDDLWWHLGLGRAYLEEGPRLAADPMLFAADGPPAPAAWLFDAGVYALLNIVGFGGLRVFHVLWVTGILCFAWRTVRSVGASRAVAGLVTGAFIVLAAYRLFQLRPELATILLTLSLYVLVIAPPRSPSYTRVAVAAALCALWVNLHAGFLLGPILIGAAMLGIVATLPLQSAIHREEQGKRAVRLLLALVLALLATLLNPVGPEAHLAYFAAGDTTPDLAVVSDEWSPLALFSWPRANTPPAPLVWGLVWIAVLGMFLAAPYALRSWRREDTATWVDPALIAVAAASLAAPLVAVRFAWMAFFALLLLARLGRHRMRGTLPALATAAVAGLLVPAYLYLGDWSFLSRGVPRSLDEYTTPYPAHKYFANAAWFLRDAGVEGNLFTNYYQGGFYGLWLAPRVRPFVNGSLNVSPSTVDDYLAIQTGFGLTSRDEMLERLAANNIDLFVGVGLPSAPPPNRPWRYTTSHLEGAADWLLVYRDLQSAVYLRLSTKGREQIAPIARYYAAEGVPFDPERGLDVDAVLREAPEWAMRQGLIPKAFPEYARAVSQGSPAVRNRIASVYAGLGLYTRAVEIDRSLMRGRPPRETPRRLVWCLLHLDRVNEALDASRRLGNDPLSAYLAAAAQRMAEQPDPGRRALELVFLPAFHRAEINRIASGRVPTTARPFRAP